MLDKNTAGHSDASDEEHAAMNCDAETANTLLSGVLLFSLFVMLLLSKGLSLHLTSISAGY